MQPPSRAWLDALGHSHPAFDFAGWDPQPRRQAVHHYRRHRGLVGWVGDLAEHPIHQSAVGALLGLPPFGHLHPKRGAHPVRRQRAHLGMGGVNLIWRRAKPLARRLTSDQFAHTPTLSNAHVSHDTRMRTHTHPGDENGSGDPRPRHSKMSEPDARRLRRARNDRGERRADPGRAVDPQMATDRFDAVDQSDQT